MAKTKIRVVHTTKREVPIYKHELVRGRHVPTDKVLEVKEVERSRVLFSGSETAFEIWKQDHVLPPDAKITRKVKRD